MFRYTYLIVIPFTLSLISCGGEIANQSCDVYDSTTEAAKHQSCVNWLTANNSVRQDLNAGILPNSPQPDEPLNDLVWDDKLAQVAYNYAIQCQSFSHNANRLNNYLALGGTESSVGENIAVASHPTYTEEQMVTLWAGEEADYIYEPFDGSGVDGAVVGHYTQMIWRDTTHVGCALVNCEGQPIGWKWFAVCNYAQAGNYLGQYPY